MIGLALILMMHEYDVTHRATAATVQDGPWCDAETWGGILPGESDTVRIDHDVTLCDFDTTVMDVAVHGSLTVTEGRRLRCRTLQVHGDFCILGSGHVQWRNVPLDEHDPEELSRGALVHGSWTTIGLDKLSWTRATHSLSAGDSVVTVEVDTDPCGGDANWQVGDEIVIGNSTQKPILNDAGDHELYRQSFGRSHVAVIIAIEGSAIYFDPPLPHDAPGASSNPFGFEAYTPVGNLTRSTTVSSENPLDGRGHLMAMNGAQFTAINTTFQGMGRTDPWEFVGPDNQIGRYSLHMHRHTSPDSLVYLEGCVVRDFGKWGISLHEAYDGTVTNNVFFDGIGSAVVTERGNEVRNSITGNLICAVKGGRQFAGIRGGERGGAEELSYEVEGLDGTGDFAMDGSGIWCRSVGNTIADNVICDVAGYGVNVNGFYAQTNAKPGRGRLPISPGLGQAPEGEHGAPVPGQVAGNEIIGSFGGLWLTYSQGEGRAFARETYKQSHYNEFKVWHTSKDITNIWHEAYVAMDDWIVVADLEAEARNQRGSILFNASPLYDHHAIEFGRLRSHGTHVAIEAPPTESARGNPADLGHVYVRDSVVYCFIAIVADKRSDGSSVTYEDSQVILDPDFNFAGSDREPAWLWDARRMQDDESVGSD